MVQKVVIKRYSIAFKQKIVRKYEAGDSIKELRETYAIGGSTTIQRWVVKYGQKGLRHKLLIIQSPEEQNQVKVLKERIGQLEKLVARLSLDKLMLESSLAEAEELLGGAVKKNGAAKSLGCVSSELSDHQTAKGSLW